MTKQELLKEQFASTYNQTDWFVPLLTAVEGLTAEQAAKKDSSNNSIWQIVNHINFWNRRYLNRFKGIPNPETTADNDSTFEGDRISGTQEEWIKTVDQADKIMAEWARTLEEADDTKLDSKPIKGSDVSWYSYIGMINTHNAYHIGQIVSIRKIQGSWDPKRGVN